MCIWALSEKVGSLLEVQLPKLTGGKLFGYRTMNLGLRRLVHFLKSSFPMPTGGKLFNN